MTLTDGDSSPTNKKSGKIMIEVYLQKILRNQESIKEDLRQHQKAVRKLFLNEHSKRSSVGRGIISRLPVLPLKSADDVQEMESALEDEEQRIILVS